MGKLSDRLTAQQNEVVVLSTAGVGGGLCSFRGWPARFELDERCPSRPGRAFTPQ